jgi:hypothetical protein
MEVDKSNLADLLKDSGYDAANNQFLEKIPREQKRRICALKKIQLESMQVESEFYSRVHALEKEFEPIFDKIFEKRKNIVSGEHEPTDEEAKIDLIHGLAAEELEELYSKSEADTGSKGIPDFWLNVLRSSDLISDLIQEHDEPILKYLTDVTTSVDMSPPGFTLLFHFAPNPFFKNTTLKKFYELQIKLDEEDPFEFDGPTVVKAVGDEIQWADGKNITKKVVKKKQKKGPNAGRFLTKTIKAESFFNFFEPPQPEENKNEEEEEDPEVAELARADFEIGQVLRDHIIPRAVLFVTGEADINDDMFDFDGEGDDEEGVSDEEDEE